MSNAPKRSRFVIIATIIIALTSAATAASGRFGFIDLVSSWLSESKSASVLVEPKESPRPEAVNSITSLGTAFTENFDSLDQGTNSTLPAGFRVNSTNDWTSGTTVVTVGYGTTGTGVVTGTSAGGTVNWGNGATGSATDRSLGFLTTGSFSSPRSIILKFTNNTGSTISKLDIGFDYEKYRSGTRQFDWTFFHGSAVSPATSAVAGDQSYAADANNTVVSNPPTTISKSVSLSGLSIANGSDYYLRWTYTGLAGSTNAQGLGVDNLSITASTTPVVTASAASSVTSSAATMNGNVTSDGGATITERGFYWKSGTGVTTANGTKVTVAGTTGTFNSTLSSLLSSTQYSYIAFATNSSGTTVSTPETTFTTNAAPPTVTSVSPTSGSTAGGTSVTITGTNFTGATAVTIGGNPATPFIVNSATSITAPAPAHAAGQVDVVVTTPGGTGTGTNLYTYVAPTPTITLDTTALTFPTTNVSQNSTGQTKGISGSNLTANITCSAGTSDFQVSTDGTSWGSGATFVQSGGTVTGATLHTRFRPQSAGAKNDTISCLSSGATTQSFAVSGTGNNPPDAVNDTVTGSVGTASYVINVLTNDTTDAGETLTVTGVTQPSGGVATITGGGTTVTFTPTNPNVAALYNFTYTISDGNGGQDTATVTVNVIAPPIAVNDRIATPVNSPTGRNAPGLLANDTLNGATITAHTDPASGTLNTFGTDGSFTYTPANGFSGDDTFTYTLTNSAGSSTATVTIYVDVLPFVTSTNPVNNSQTVPLNSTITINFSEPVFTTNAFSISPNIAFAQSPADGNTTSSFVLTPSQPLTSGTTYTVTVNGFQVADADGGLSPTANFTFVFTAQPRPSLLNDGFAPDPLIIARSGETIDTTPFSVLDNDNLFGGSLYTFGPTGPTANVPVDGTSTASTQSGGTVLLRPDGTFQYTSAPGFSGSDRFFYLAVNGVVSPPNNVPRAQVQITVTAPEIAVEEPAGTDRTSAYTSNFGAQTVLTGQTKTYTIKNVGTGILSLGTVTRTGSTDYAITQPASSLLTPNASTTFDVTFTPTSIGTITGQVQIPSIAPDNDFDENPFIINLTGTGSPTGAQTYTWTGGSVATPTDWNVAANWSPLRISKNPGDVLRFTNSTPTPTVTNVAGATAGSTETIASLEITGSSPTFSSPAGNSLVISAGTGNTGLTMDSSGGLNVTGANALTVSLAGGTTANINGLMTFGGGAHRLLSTTQNSVTFGSTAIFSTQTGFTGSAFGDGAAVDPNSPRVVFIGGSRYIHNSGASPFGLASSQPLVAFQAGSEAVWLTNSGFQASGRTYANLRIGLIGPSGIAASVSDSGTGNFNFNDLNIDSPSFAGASTSTLAFNGSGTSTIGIHGNVFSNGPGAGGSLPDLNITPGSGGIQVSSGTALTFGNTGGSARGLNLDGNVTISGNTSVALARIVQLGLSNVNTKTVIVNGLGDGLTGGPSGYVIGSVQKPCDNSTNGSLNTLYPVGTTSGYSGVEFTNGNCSNAVTRVNATGAKLPAISGTNALDRYWSLSLVSGTFNSTNLTFNYQQSDVPGTANENSFAIFKYDGSTLTQPGGSVNTTANTATINGVTSFSDWTLAGVTGTLQFSSPTYSVSEGVASATITVTRTGGDNGAVGASYATVAGGTATGGGTCAAGIDYVTTSGTVLFADSDSSPKTFSVTICPDAIQKSDETINLALTSPAGGATLGTPNTAVLTITNDDAAPSFSIDDVTVTEGNSGTVTAAFTVTKSGDTTLPSTIHFATQDGTATVANGDYVSSSGDISFTAAQTSATVNITVNGDTTFEPNETFNVLLSTVVNGNATISDDTGVGTINNDDCQPDPQSVVTNTNDSGPGSLRDVVAKACSGNTVTFNFGPPPVRPESPTADIISLSNGQITIDKNLTIQGPGANNLTIRNTQGASNTSRVFVINANLNVTINGVTISGGNLSGANDGGGIYNFGGGTLTIANSIVTDNSAPSGSGGGVLSGGGTLNLNSVVVSGNSASFAGGLYSVGGAVNITSSTFDSNTAVNNGGGAIISGGTNNTIRTSTFSRNTAQSCGGLQFDTAGSTLVLFNSTISGNSATSSSGGGGGLCVYGGSTTTITNATITDNHSDASGLGGGIYLDDAATSLTLKNTIVARNTAGITAQRRPDINRSAGTLTSGGYNLIGVNFNAFIAFPAGNPNANNDIVGDINSPKNPLLAPLANNGGPTQTHALLSGSPAYDKGSAATTPLAELMPPITTDQRGSTRPVDNTGIANATGGDGSDIGAVEMQITTAAEVSISGRVLSSEGRGITNARITVTGDSLPAPRVVFTGRSGAYVVNGLLVGETYIVTVGSRRFTFIPASRAITLVDNVIDLDFIAEAN